MQIADNPSANRDVASGKTYPTAVRQTVTLLFADPLPAGSYVVELLPGIQTAAFNEGEAGLLSGGSAFAGHPVVSLDAGQVRNGSRREATDLVMAAGALGSFAVFETGTPFLALLHDNLEALLDAGLTRSGDDRNITQALLKQIVDRVGPALGAAGQRPTKLLVVWLDPVSIGLEDPAGDTIDYDLPDNTIVGGIDGGYINVIGNIEVLVVPTAGGTFTLTVRDVPATARGGAVLLALDETRTVPLTDPLREGTRSFSFPL